MGELLPCPFCGSTALADDVSRFLGEARWAVECENEDCWARTKDYAEQTEAVATWNKRAGIEALEARCERYREALRVLRLGSNGVIDSDDAQRISYAVENGDAIDWAAYPATTRTALEAELATCRAAMAVMDNTVAALEYENSSLKAIVQGWHWLAVGPDEMGDYYTQKQLIKESEPYASPALKEIGDG